MSFIDQDRPAQPPFPDIPNWTENYCFAGDDPGSGIGLWLHTGRWLNDITLWRDVVILRLPDGSVVAHRAYGNALATEDGPGGANFSIRVVEGRRRFRLRFLGAARRVRSTEMTGGLVGDGPVERVEFDLEFISDRPIWDMRGVSDRQGFAGTGHVEQLGHATGEIKVGRDRFFYDGLCHRDHSVGPRDASQLGSHHWIQGLFQNGIGFALYHAVLRGKTEPAFAKAVVWDRGELYEASVTLPVMIQDGHDAVKPFPLVIDYARGRLDIAVTELTSTAWLSFSAPNEEYIGVFPAPAGKTPIILLEQSGRYRLADGTLGHGPVERSIPGRIHHEEY